MSEHYEVPDEYLYKSTYTEELEDKLSDAGSDIQDLKLCLGEVSALLHEYAPDHDPENWRGCTHKDCVRAKNLLKAQPTQHQAKEAQETP